jgi:F-type H+-transporting ATPase subunit delta
MISVSVANRYASALVDVLLAPGSDAEPAQAMEQLRAFEAAVESSPPLRSVLATPSISVARKRAVIRTIAETLGMGRVVQNFLLVLTDHRRTAALSQMIEAFDLMLDERLGFVRAEVRSAREMPSQQQDEIVSRLSALAGTKVRMRFAIDPELIGGVTARIGSTVYDGSVRGRLAGMRKRLAAN